MNTGVDESISSNNFPDIISFAKPEPVFFAAPVESKKPEPVAAANNKKETAIVKKAPAPVSEDSFDMDIPDFGEAFDNEP